MGVEAEVGINWTRVQEGMQLVTVQSPKVGQQEGNLKGIRITYLILSVLCGTYGNNNPSPFLPMFCEM